MTARTTATASADSTTAETCGATRPSSASTITAPTRCHEIRRQTTALNAAWPARNSAGPARTSQATQGETVPLAPGCAAALAVAPSAAAATMIPATITG